MGSCGFHAKKFFSGTMWLHTCNCVELNVVLDPGTLRQTFFLRLFFVVDMQLRCFGIQAFRIRSKFNDFPDSHSNFVGQSSSHANFFCRYVFVIEFFKHSFSSERCRFLEIPISHVDSNAKVRTHHKTSSYIMFSDFCIGIYV